MKAHIYAGALLALVATPAFANGPIAVAGALANAEQYQSQLQGQGQSSDNSVTNRSGGDSRALGLALGQAPTAAYGCLKGNRIVFGLIEWTDDSSKCENYAIARIAANRGEWDLANQWVSRADGL